MRNLSVNFASPYIYLRYLSYFIAMGRQKQTKECHRMDELYDKLVSRCVEYKRK